MPLQPPRYAARWNSFAIGLARPGAGRNRALSLDLLERYATPPGMARQRRWPDASDPMRQAVS
jgi:hypothetical protein